MSNEASTLDSMIAEAREMQADGRYVNGRVFHALADEIERLRAERDNFQSGVVAAVAKITDTATFLDRMAERIHMLRRDEIAIEAAAADCRAMAERLRAT